MHNRGSSTFFLLISLQTITFTMFNSPERIHKNKNGLTNLNLRRINMMMLMLCLLVATHSIKVTYLVSTLRHTSEPILKVSNRKLAIKSSQHQTYTARQEMTNSTLAKEAPTPTGSSPSLHFLIAGFPKCGTTTLLYAFGRHAETSISGVEKCSFANPNHSDGIAVAKLTKDLMELDPSPAAKRGIKCPTGIKNYRAIERLKRHSPETHILIGLRHPIFFFQSYYNYRVTETYDKKLKETIPPVETLVGNNDWKGVSTDAARFEVPLMQLGKTGLTMADLDLLANRPHAAVVASPFRIFLYSLEQLKDPDGSRAKDFRDDMQNFMGLETSIPPFGHENLNHFVGKKAYPETIDICNAKYRELRSMLISQSLKTREWIHNQFIVSEDVTVGGEEYFLELMNTWGIDPCA